jgi:U3 small nucleolar RNA-associated protein 15
MSNFKATTLATLPSIIEPLTECAKYWQNSLEAAKVAKEFSAINCIDINSRHDILVTSSTRLAVYEYYSMEVKRSFTTTNFVPLFGANYRKSDSKLIVCGSGDGVVRVWDVKNSKPLRSLGLNDKNHKSKHSAAVRRTHFCDNSQVVSLSDDKDIKLWDITEESLISTFGEKSGAHNDYIRASHFIDNSSTLISGSYDHSVKLWDTRSPQKEVNNLDHGSPVESITVRNLVAISGGGDTIKIFDIIAGKVMKTLVKTHHKTVTCVYNYGQYLLTASIDGHLKVYDSNFNIASSLTYSPAQLLSCALDDKVLAVGANDGLFSVNKFKDTTNEEKTKSNQFRNKRYFMSNTFNDSEDYKRKIDALDGAIVVKGVKKNKHFLSKHDELLKKFNHSLALNRVLRANANEPEVVVSFIQELIRRAALKSSLAGRTDKDLKVVVEFLIKYIRDPRFSRILVDTALILTEVYMPHINRSIEIQSMFKRLNNVINSELNCMQQMLEIAGQLSSLINSSIK